MLRYVKTFEEPAITSFLELHNVSQHFTIRQGMFDPEAKILRAVDNISLTVSKGETLGLAGESGCGKSTLARMIARLLRPTAGDIYLEGESLWNSPRSFVKTLPQRIQMVFQDPASSLNPRKKIGKSIQEALDIHAIGTRAKRKQQANELLGMVGLRPEHYNRYPHEFSGGQRQRIAIARALVLNPEIIICDEPVSALDVSVQAQVINLFKALQKRLGLTYIFISHDLAVMSHISDRIAIMYLGNIVELASAQQLFANPSHPYTRTLLNALPAQHPRERKNTVENHPTVDIPNPLLPLTGCPFHTRCPHVMDICRTTTPAWTPLSSASRDESSSRENHSTATEHGVLCHLYSS